MYKFNKLLCFVLLVSACQKSESDHQSYEKEYYNSGELKKLIYITNGANTKISKTYYKTGKLMSIEHYIKGMRQGKQLMYHANGKKKAELTYKNDKIQGNYKDFNLNGVLTEEGVISKGCFVGIRKSYSSDGNVWQIASVKDNELTGPFVWYHPNGRKKAHGTFNNSKINGVLVFCDSISGDSSRLLFKDNKFLRFVR